MAADLWVSIYVKQSEQTHAIIHFVIYNTSAIIICARLPLQQPEYSYTQIILNFFETFFKYIV